MQLPDSKLTREDLDTLIDLAISGEVVDSDVGTTEVIDRILDTTARMGTITDSMRERAYSELESE